MGETTTELDFGTWDPSWTLPPMPTFDPLPSLEPLPTLEPLPSLEPFPTLGGQQDSTSQSVLVTSDVVTGTNVSESIGNLTTAATTIRSISETTASSAGSGSATTSAYGQAALTNAVSTYQSLTNNPTTLHEALTNQNSLITNQTQTLTTVAIPAANGNLSSLQTETTWERDLFISIYVLFILAILALNLGLIVTIFRSKKLRTRSVYIFIVSFACANLCVATLVLPYWILEYFVSPEVGSILCKVYRYFELASECAWIICMLELLEAADKLNAHRIAPKDDIVTVSEARRNICVGWLVALVYAIRAPFLYDLTNMVIHDGQATVSHVICGVPVHFGIEKIFVVVDAFFLYLIPGIALLSAYLHFIRRMKAIDTWKDKKSLKKKVILMLFTLTLLFLITKMAAHAVTIVQFWSPTLYAQFPLARRLAAVLSYVNCWLSFVPVWVFNKKLRNAFAETCPCWRNSVKKIKVSPQKC